MDVNLPESYWEIIKNKNLNISTSNGIFITIPVFGERIFIKKTLENLTVNQENFEVDGLTIIVVYKKVDESDETPAIIDQFNEDHSNINVVSINEEDFPDKTCIGHARAIGFASALHIASEQGFGLAEIILMSSDADLVAVDAHYLSKVKAAFETNETMVVSCENRLSDEAMSIEYINILKVIEDGFFFTQFKTIGALNGRCYALRGSAYVTSGGVDYTAQFDDIRFGVTVHRTRDAQNEYTWMNSYVINSERRIKQSIERDSLLSGYADRKSLGNEHIEADDDKSTNEIKKHIVDHINEGFNTMMFYYSLRHSFSEDQVGEFLKQYDVFVSYMDTHMERYEIVNIDEEALVEKYKLFSSGEVGDEWWRTRHSFELQEF